jgi:hypothetical protein
MGALTQAPMQQMPQQALNYYPQQMQQGSVMPQMQPQMLGGGNGDPSGPPQMMGNAYGRGAAMQDWRGMRPQFDPATMQRPEFRQQMQDWRQQRPQMQMPQMYGQANLQLPQINTDMLAGRHAASLAAARQPNQPKLTQSYLRRG